MTSFSLSHPDRMRLQRQGWICSVLFHAIMGTCALALLSGIQTPFQPDHFEWHVAMVETSRPQQKPDAPSETRPTPTPPKPRMAKMQALQPQPVVETVQQKPIQPVEAVQRVVQRERTQAVYTAAPVTTVNQTASAITQAVHHSEPGPTVAPTTTREAVVQEEQVVTTTGAAVSPQAAEPVVEHAVTEPTGDPALHQQQVSVERTVVRTVQAQALPATKADYGWLMKALLGRVDQLKNYPHMARLNRWEGKVVLRAVITEDGQVLMVDVHESSGRPILDNDAIETLRKASPLKLEYPLGKPQVAILMPISYSLR